MYEIISSQFRCSQEKYCCISENHAVTFKPLIDEGLLKPSRISRPSDCCLRGTNENESG